MKGGVAPTLLQTDYKSPTLIIEIYGEDDGSLWIWKKPGQEGQDSKKEL